MGGIFYHHCGMGVITVAPGFGKAWWDEVCFQTLTMPSAVLFPGATKSQQNRLDATQLTPGMGYKETATCTKSLNSAGAYIFKTGWKEVGNSNASATPFPFSASALLGH